MTVAVWKFCLRFSLTLIFQVRWQLYDALCADEWRLQFPKVLTVLGWLFAHFYDLHYRVVGSSEMLLYMPNFLFWSLRRVLCNTPSLVGLDTTCMVSVYLTRSRGSLLRYRHTLAGCTSDLGPYSLAVPRRSLDNLTRGAYRVSFVVMSALGCSSWAFYVIFCISGVLPIQLLFWYSFDIFDIEGLRFESHLPLSFSSFSFSFTPSPFPDKPSYCYNQSSCPSLQPIHRHVRFLLLLYENFPKRVPSIIPPPSISAVFYTTLLSSAPSSLRQLSDLSKVVSWKRCMYMVISNSSKSQVFLTYIAERSLSSNNAVVIPDHPNEKHIQCELRTWSLLVMADFLCDLKPVAMRTMLDVYQFVFKTIQFAGKVILSPSLTRCIAISYKYINRPWSSPDWRMHPVNLLQSPAFERSKLIPY